MKASDNTKIACPADSKAILMLLVINFLKLFMSDTCARRLVAIILLIASVEDSRVEELTGISPRTIWTIRKAVEAGDIDSLFWKHQGKGAKSKLAKVKDEILQEVRTHDYHSRREIAAMIDEKFHIKVSETAVGRFLKKNNNRRLKCGSLPAKANAEEQERFYEETLLPLMKAAQNGKIELVFLDGVHFVMGCDYLGYIWGETRRFVKTFSGRQRYNVLGGLNYTSKKIHTVANDTYLTATQVCEMCADLREYYGKDATIKVVLDNARYQKCQVVWEAAKEYNIDLVYIPPYSPNLNLIERVWRFCKTELRSKFYNDFSVFCEKIDDILGSTTGKNKARMDTLIGEKVQLFTNLVEVAENTFGLTPPAA